MFLHVLDPVEAEAFVDAAWHLIHTDADVDEREEVLIAELQNELHIDPAPHRGLTAEQVLGALRELESDVVRRVVLLELAGIAIADGEMHENEIAFLTASATAMALPTELVDELVDFAQVAQGVWMRGRQRVAGTDAG